jgi:hypothetical protein
LELAGGVFYVHFYVPLQKKNKNKNKNKIVQLPFVVELPLDFYKLGASTISPEARASWSRVLSTKEGSCSSPTVRQ